jgi:hypothetical protein
MGIFFMFMFMPTFAKIEGTDPKDVYHPTTER